MKKTFLILISALILSFIVIKVDRIFKPSIAFKYYFTDQLREDKELLSLLLKPGVLVKKIRQSLRLKFYLI